MRYLLNAIYVCLLLVFAPAIAYAAIWRGKYRNGLSQKLLGRVPQLEPSRQRIWFHAVSVGEVNLLAKLIAKLTATIPDIEVVISTTTQTGFELAKKNYSDRVVFYCPLDFTWAVSNAFDRLRPTVFCLAELELWPNLLLEAKKRDVPVAIVNGRLSDRSFRGYQRLGGLIRRWLSHIKLVTAQSETCAKRFTMLGVDREHVHAVGSLKFDGALTDRNNRKTKALRTLAGIQQSDVVFIAGSTQSPEEELALRVYRSLEERFTNLRLIIVPRHPERFDEVAKMIRKTETPFQRRSELKSPASSRVLLVDTVGELGAWWGCADIGFVGGSMGSRGGQNMIEPAAYGVATCFGPNTKNFRSVVSQLIHQDAARTVESEEALGSFVERCLADRKSRLAFGERAQQLVLSQRGAVDKTVELLSQLVSNEGLLQRDGESIPFPKTEYQRRRSA